MKKVLFLLKWILPLLKDIIVVMGFPLFRIACFSWAFSVSYIIFFSVCKALHDVSTVVFLGDNFSMILSVFVSTIVAFHYVRFEYRWFYDIDVKEKQKKN